MDKTKDAAGILRRAATSGALAGLATTFAAALAGKLENGAYTAPLNAISHVFWGDKAAQKDRVSLKYTATGILLNHASAIFWALFYEKWFGQRGASRGTSEAAPRSLAKPILGAAAVTAGSYIIDYHLIPERFTPGFEKRLSGKSLATIFGVLAVGLVACDLIDAAKSRRRD